MPEWKDTVNLPRTGFSMKANLPASEPLALARWAEIDLYGKIRERRRGSPTYVLHDGPPYANGAAHLGHFVNKVLNDIVVDDPQALTLPTAAVTSQPTTF